MQRQIPVSLVFMAMAMGCRSTGGGPVSQATATTAVPTPGGGPDRTAQAVGETVSIGAGSVSVVAVEDNVDAGRLFAPPRGDRYVAAQVRGCAGPNEPNVNFHPEYFSLRLGDHTEHDGDRGVKKPSLERGTIPAGSCSAGWVTFVVPARARPIAVVYHGSTDVTWNLNG
jgi:hypothetical protein